jgi:hypothetical protein
MFGCKAYVRLEKADKALTKLGLRVRQDVT